jgi:hypothetical protein
MKSLLPRPAAMMSAPVPHIINAKLTGDVSLFGLLERSEMPL